MSSEYPVQSAEKKLVWTGQQIRDYITGREASVLLDPQGIIGTIVQLLPDQKLMKSMTLCSIEY